MKRARLTMEWTVQGLTGHRPIETREFSYLTEMELGLKMWREIQSFKSWPTVITLELLP